MQGHVGEDIINPMMPDKVVERLEGNIWENERGIRKVMWVYIDLCTC